MDGHGRRAHHRVASSRTFLCRRPLFLLLALFGATAIGLFFTSQHLHQQHAPVELQPQETKQQDRRKIHICLCSDDTDLRAAAVAIKSAYVAASDPERLQFHFVTVEEYTDVFRDLFSAHLPSIPIQMHHKKTLLDELETFVFKADKDAKRQLPITSAFDLVPYHLHEIFKDKIDSQKMPIQKIIYLSTDAVMLGDAGELLVTNLGKKSCALSQDCSELCGDSFDLEQLSTFQDQDHRLPDSSECVARQGVMVMDLKAWNEQGISNQVLQWLSRYRTAKRPLWSGRTPGSALQLALNGGFKRLEAEWSCGGLANISLTVRESALLMKEGFARKDLKQLQGHVEKQPSGDLVIHPHIATCSRRGKLLHFSGPRKPWNVLEESDEEDKGSVPMCARPTLLQWTSWTWSFIASVACDGFSFVRCADIWSVFLSREALCGLKDFDKEWRQDEAVWAQRRKQKQLAEAPELQAQIAEQSFESEGPGEDELAKMFSEIEGQR